MRIVNRPSVNEQRVNDMRPAIEHRATWLYLLVDEAEKAGLSWEEFARKAVTRCGVFHGNTKFTQTEDLQAFAKEFGNELYSKIFEMDVKEASAEKFEVHFHYCPLVAAWFKHTQDEKKIEKLCDIAMDGDRGIISAFPKFTFELGDTIAKGGKVCEIVIRKTRASQAAEKGPSAGTHPPEGYPAPSRSVAWFDGCFDRLSIPSRVEGLRRELSRPRSAPRFGAETAHDERDEPRTAPGTHGKMSAPPCI